MFVVVMTAEEKIKVRKKRKHFFTNNNKPLKFSQYNDGWHLWLNKKETCYKGPTEQSTVCRTTATLDIFPADTYRQY